MSGSQQSRQTFTCSSNRWWSWLAATPSFATSRSLDSFSLSSEPVSHGQITELHHQSPCHQSLYHTATSQSYISSLLVIGACITRPLHRATSPVSLSSEPVSHGHITELHHRSPCHRSLYHTATSQSYITSTSRDVARQHHCLSIITRASVLNNNNNNNNNNNLIYKAPNALASDALAAGQSWVLLKSLMKEVRLKPRFKDRTVSQHWLMSQATSSRQLSQSNEKLVSWSLSWWMVCPVVGQQTSEVSVHWREPWCDDWGISVMWRCCGSWRSTQPPCTRFCVELLL